jgi:hypothetical protein
MFHFPVAAVAGLTDDICLKITTFQQKCKHKKTNDKKSFDQLSWTRHTFMMLKPVSYSSGLFLQ